jgi:hypothetical protein
MIEPNSCTNNLAPIFKKSTIIKSGNMNYLLEINVGTVKTITCSSYLAICCLRYNMFILRWVAKPTRGYICCLITVPPVYYHQ